MYNDRMEKAFVVDAVKAAVEQIEKNGEAAFSTLPRLDRTALTLSRSDVP
jgi:hypothetical protein